MPAKRAPEFPAAQSVTNVNVLPPSPSGSVSRTPSPSLGNLFRPNKWFQRQRTTSSSKSGTLQPPDPVQTSIMSRKPRISSPTDPRPIPPEALTTMNAASRSVLELAPPAADSLGDLRSISRKQWSRSFDDLSRMTQTEPIAATPRQRARIDAYRAGTSPVDAVSFPTLGTSPPPVSRPPPPPPLPLDVPAKRPRSRSFQALKQQPPPSPISPKASFPPIRPRAPLSPKSSFPPINPSSSPRKHHHPPAFGFGFPKPEPPEPSPVTENLNTVAMDPRRMSQIIHLQGFLNKHPSITSAGSAPPSQHALAKGWKPYKVVVKGAKLLCYKPPTDRATSVKDLFPAGTAAAIEEEEEEGAEHATKDSPVESRSKARRAYWGTAKHPELVLGEDGTVHSGTAEALVHECIYATTYGEDDRWRTFASAVLLCLPRIAGQEKFETEFRRYASRMLPENAERVAWLVAKYVHHIAVPPDGKLVPVLDGWRNWCASADVGLITDEHPSLDSWFAVTSPTTSIPAIIFNASSPTKTTFEAIPEHPVRERTVSIQPGLLHALRTERLTREVFLALPAPAIASSLRVYFHGALSSAMNGIPAEWADCSTSGARRLRSHALLNPNRMRDFTGSDNSPHWLTSIILHQLLLSPVVKQISPTASHTSGSPTQRHAGLVQENEEIKKSTATRPAVLSHWVNIGERARKAGDWTTWRAIAAALCSRPIARLDRLWKRVDGQTTRNIVVVWSALLAADPQPGTSILGGSASSALKQTDPRRAPKLPWLGDVPEQARNILQSAGTGGAAKGDEWEVDMLLQVDALVSRSATRLGVFDPNALDYTADHLSDGDMAALVQFWEQAANLNLRNQDMHFWMSISTRAEDRLRSRYVQYFWSSSGPLPVHNILPLLFIEGLPAISFIDRGIILRTRREFLESDATRPIFYERQIARSSRVGRPSMSSSTGSSGGSSMSAMKALTMFDGELTLLVQPGELASGGDISGSGLERKMSVNHGIRVSPAGSKPSLERKNSAARRSSLPILSNSRPDRSSLNSHESSDPPLSAIVKAGTLDRLVDVLVHGLQGITVGAADDNGEMSLRESRARPLAVDSKEFQKVWWFTFRSFVTPHVFFELLRKRYLMATPGLRIEVLTVVKDWITLGSGAQDALDNPDLWDGLKSFLSAPSQQSVRASGFMGQPSNTVELEELEQLRKETLETFLRHTLRPRLRPVKHDKQVSMPNFPPSPPRIDDLSPEDFATVLDATITSLMRTLQADDFFAVADCLETLATDPTAWYNLVDEAVENGEIHSIYSMLQDLQLPDVLWNVGGPPDQRLQSILPAAMGGVLRGYNAMHKWLLFQIASPELGLQKREQRMECLLRAIEVCRARTLPRADDVGSNVHPFSYPCARSMVETLLVNVVLSSSSRVFTRAWANVAANRNVTADSLATLLTRSTMPHINDPNIKLCPDFGWALERMIEVLCIEDTVSNPGPGTSLINLEKRRYLTDFIASTLADIRTRSDDLEDDDVSRVRAMYNDSARFDLRLPALLEAAHAEAAQGGRSRQKITPPFQAMLSAQHEKSKRDRHIRHHLSKAKRVEQARAEKRDEDISRAMMNGRKTGTAPLATKHQRSKKSMSALYKLMRPLSTAFSSDGLFDAGRGMRRTPAELDFEPSGSPAVVISLVDARVSAFVNNQRAFVFHLDTEDGGRYLFQGMSKLDMNKWISAINKVAQSSQRKRLTYLSSNPKPVLPGDQIQSNNPHDPTRVFGVELQFLLERETGSTDVPPGTIPQIITLLLEAIEARGLEEEGIYRIAGVKSTNDAIKQTFNSGRPVDMSADLFADVFSLCDTLKSWFRELPSGLVPESMFQKALLVTQHQDFENRLDAARQLVHDLPTANFHLLRRIIEHLTRVTDFEDVNHMNPMNLAIVFSGNLFRGPDGQAAFFQMGHTHQLTRLLILNFHSIFDQPPSQPGGDENNNEGDQGEDDEDLNAHETGEDQVLDEVIEEDEEDEELQPVSRSGITPLSSPGSDTEGARTIAQSYFPDMNLHVDTSARFVNPPAHMTDYEHAQSPIRSPPA
ncbi:hypothetical protein BKA62DRAFT_642445 [Auriculariales sp. MPI-PUGE-AT-0066]|nr:hypothetical protein BKA62DRAFT_642445 [Auriculariales sp. MPI-PUGE-AT-0066]